MIYVALLRGINVGGKSKVEMARLKKLFESLGCGDVITYINSGNIVFSDARSMTALTPLIEKAIYKEFDLEIRVLLRDYDNISRLCKQIPTSWTNDDQQRTDVLFLWSEIDEPTIMNKLVFKPEIERVRYLDGALVWNIARKDARRGSSVKLIKTDLYKCITFRNVNTVRKIKSLMDG